jgi:glutamate racemase
LVILACNTASAKALRNIQQKDLPYIDPNRRVLGVIRPTTEIAGNYSKTKQIGVLATQGTVASESYVVELNKFFPEVKVFQEACPMWVPLIENNEYESVEADSFIKKNLDNLFSKSADIDTIILGCTHYPILINKIKKHIPKNVTLLSQGAIIAESLVKYLSHHNELEMKCSKGGSRVFYTTDSTDSFDKHATLFFGKEVKSNHLTI